MENSFRPVVSFALKDAKFQILAAVIAHSLVIHAGEDNYFLLLNFLDNQVDFFLGINMAFSTIVLPQIMNSTMSRRNETITDAMRVDKDQATWIGRHNIWVEILEKNHFCEILAGFRNYWVNPEGVA